LLAAWSASRAAAYSAFNRATNSAVAGTSSIVPTPCPALQMSRQALVRPLPKLALSFLALGSAFGSRPAAAMLGFR
jgi:hypothetical protein